MKKWGKLCIVSLMAFLFISSVKASAYTEAIEKAKNDGKTCIYADDYQQYVYGYTVSVGLFSNTANYQFYLFDGSPSSKTYLDTGVEAVYSKNSCNPYVIACLNDDPMHFYYKENSSSFVNVYGNNTTCTSKQTTLSLIDPYMLQEEGIEEARDNYKCVYRDENNTIAATNLNSVLGLTDVYLLRYNGNPANDVISVIPPEDDKCPTYFLYARQSDEGSFGGIGNNTFYTQFGNDFNDLCKIAKTKDNIAYEVLTLSSEELPSTACSSTTPINGNQEDLGNANNVLLGDAEGMDICSQNGVKNVLHVIGYLLFAVKIAVPLLLVIMGSIDFAQALMASDDKAIKDATAKLVKRVIAGIIVFFIPTILNFGLGLIDGVSDNQTNFTGCSSCLFTPFDGSCTYTKIGE